ncbi:MAG TPA: hypothetical protein VFK33_16000 [Bacillales bacterium]|nr:hypothetical protein [Bacillales bacterium]
MTQLDKNQQGKASRNAMMWILLFFGYEWLVSGLNKLIHSEDFIGEFQNEVSEAIRGGTPFSFYGDFLNSIVIPNAEGFAVFILAGELFTGGVFILIGILGLAKVSLTGWVAGLGEAASIVSAFLSINIFLYVGGAYFIGQADPFDEGITLDLLMFLVQLAMIGYFASRIRAGKKQKYTSQRSITG